MKRRPSAYKVRAQSAGEGMLNKEASGVISSEEKKKMIRRKSSVPENLYVYEITVPDIEEGFDDVIYYKIVIKAIGNIEWCLFRRYSEFFNVYTDISLELPTIHFESPFPKKDYSSWIGSPKSSQIEKRRRLLQDWLQEFLSITNGSVKPEDAETEEITKMQEKLDAFLEVKEKIRAHTLSQAAKIKPAVDESAIAIYGETPKIVVPKVAPSLSSVFGGFDHENKEDSVDDTDNIENKTVTTDSKSDDHSSVENNISTTEVVNKKAEHDLNQDVSVNRVEVVNDNTTTQVDDGLEYTNDKAD